MKKIISLALVLVMVLTMSVTAFATDIKQNTENKTGDTTIEYTQDESYVVTIPADITLSENGETDVKVKTSSVVVEYGKALTVSVSSSNYSNGKWYLVDTANGENKLNYSLKSGDNDVASGSTVLTVTAGTTEEQKVTLKAKLVDKAVHSGTYKDTITFTVSVVDGSIDATTMTAADLKTALAANLAAGYTDIGITMSATPDNGMFTAICNALSESSAEDGSIQMTIYGATQAPYFGKYRVPLMPAADKLRSISMPDATDVPYNAFLACYHLETVDMPKVTIVGRCAFADCPALKTINFPEATSIGEYAFIGDTALTSVNIPKATKIENGAFSGCTSLTSLELPSVTDIGACFISNISAMTTLKLTASGTITVATNATNDDWIAFKDAQTENIDLYLNTDKQSEVNGNTWHGYTFKSITFVD